MIVYEEDTDIAAEVDYNYLIVGDDLEYVGFRRVGIYTKKNLKRYNENMLYFIDMVKRIV